MKMAAVQNVSVGLSISNDSAGMGNGCTVGISGSSLVINMAHILVFLALRQSLSLLGSSTTISTSEKNDIRGGLVFS